MIGISCKNPLAHGLFKLSIDISSTMNQVHELYGIGSAALSSDHDHLFRGQEIDHLFRGQEIGTKMM
jgi:hypothetical protein